MDTNSILYIKLLELFTLLIVLLIPLFIYLFFTKIVSKKIQKIDKSILYFLLNNSTYISNYIKINNISIILYELFKCILFLFCLIDFYYDSRAFIYYFKSVFSDGIYWGAFMLGIIYFLILIRIFSIFYQLFKSNFNKPVDWKIQLKEKIINGKPILPLNFIVEVFILSKITIFLALLSDPSVLSFLLHNQNNSNEKAKENPVDDPFIKNFGKSMNKPGEKKNEKVKKSL